jgi:membrane associated rhomboid family serine protease
LIPLKDDNPIRITPIVTVGLILLNTVVFFYELSLGRAIEPFIHAYGAIPSTLIHGVSLGPEPHLPSYATVLTSMFLHGGVLHLGGNMLYLWIFGNNIEDELGHFRFILFYLLCGYMAAYVHALTDSTSMMPMIGASGAISGVLGAYLLLYPKARVLTLIPLGFFLQFVWVPAVFVLGFWIVIQFINGFFTYGQRVGGVAWFAHVGGFLAGMGLIIFFRRQKVRLGRR